MSNKVLVFDSVENALSYSSFNWGHSSILRLYSVILLVLSLIQVILGLNVY